MKITIKKKIIGGFSIITILLFILGLVAISNLKSIESATQQVNTLALPTVMGSNQLKVSFLNMGRLATEGFYETELSEIDSKYKGFNVSKQTFEQELAVLRKVVNQEQALKTSLSQTESIFQNYAKNVTAIFENKKQRINHQNTLEDILGDIEDNADDTSTLIIDFSDLEQVQSNSALKEASAIANSLESNLSSLITVSYDYIGTKTKTRADTLGNEVKLFTGQIKDKINEIKRVANNADDSGTLEEMYELADQVIEQVNGNDGLLSTHLKSIESSVNAKKAYVSSENDIQQAITKLDELLKLADIETLDSKQKVKGSVNLGVTSTIVIALVSIIVAGGIAFATVKAILRPLNKVNGILKIVATGDLTQKLDDSSKDEFGELAKNCNELIESLKQLITGISSRSSQLAAAAEQTSTVTAQTTDSIQEQKSQVGQVAAATTEMHSTSQLVTQSAEDTLNQIKNADSEAEKVKVISEENKSTIEALARDVGQAADVINKLHQDSASIGGILDVIRGVADQTNLLALNAAIEAARAGEQGRGFAVVADEVRTLASRVQKSTQEIASMIEALQAGAEKAVGVMNQGKEQTSACVEQTENASNALQLITDAVHKAYDVSSQIEQSAKEQNIVSQEISEKLESIVSIAENTATGAKQTSDSSIEVAKLAEELQQSVQQFRV
jgi:methyl-accepting chemotaxis protein